MRVLREVMTRFHYGEWSPWTVRIWTEVPMGQAFDHDLHRHNAETAIDAVPTPKPIKDVAVALLNFDARVNAIEITNENGAGEVLYKDWP